MRIDGEGVDHMNAANVHVDTDGNECRDEGREGGRREGRRETGECGELRVDREATGAAGGDGWGKGTRRGTSSHGRWRSGSWMCPSFLFVLCGHV